MLVKDVLIYCSKDQELIKLMSEKTKCQKKGYSTHEPNREKKLLLH